MVRSSERRGSKTLAEIPDAGGGDGHSRPTFRAALTRRLLIPSHSFRESLSLSPDELISLTAARFPHKFWWFMEHGYYPHTYQSLFHSMENPVEDRLCRYRMLVAGRRGGKTMSAAWEVLYYALHPGQFHWDTRREKSDKALWIQVLAKNTKVGKPSWLMFKEVLDEAGLKAGTDYKRNLSDLTIEFPNGTLIEWKTAVDPQSLRGAGLDILWIDEAAHIPSRDAYDVIHPSLMQKLGTVIGTTTPIGKNWFHKEFWSADAMDDPEVGRVEYRSIDNPYFPRKAWEYEKKRMHPLMFAQEYEASFDSMTGKQLMGIWLTEHFYEDDEIPKTEDGKLDLKIYVGIDPAITVSEDADQFAMAAIGVTQDNSTVFLLELFTGRIPFPDQLVEIAKFHRKWKPILIGIESVAYQLSLAQMVTRMDTLPPVIPMLAPGKKCRRILSMAPLFQIGKVRVRATEQEFIDEWLAYDPELARPKDDTLDAVEIALRVAGALMPDLPDENVLGIDRPMTLEELIEHDLPGTKKTYVFDEMMGGDW